MVEMGLDGKILFHGSRRRFERFDPAFWNTGEASVGVGFYFTQCPVGAAHHAMHKLRDERGEPMVYACRLTPGALVLNPWRAIGSQPRAVQERWRSMPALYAWTEHGTADSGEWFPRLRSLIDMEAPGTQGPGDRADEAVCRFLMSQGFDAIYDLEGAWTDGYVGGPVVLVLNPSAIELVEVLPAKVVDADFSRGQAVSAEDSPRPLPKSGFESRVHPMLAQPSRA